MEWNVRVVKAAIDGRIEQTFGRSLIFLQAHSLLSEGASSGPTLLWVRPEWQPLRPVAVLRSQSVPN